MVGVDHGGLEGGVAEDLLEDRDVPTSLDQFRGVGVPEDLTVKDQARLLEKAPDRMERLIRVGLRTGMRPGEVRNLRWADVRFDLGILIVRGSDEEGPTVRRYRELEQAADRSVLAASSSSDSRRGISGPMEASPSKHGFTVLAIACLAIQALESFYRRSTKAMG
jgi:hypothetical protein